VWSAASRIKTDLLFTLPCNLGAQTSQSWLLEKKKIEKKAALQGF